MLRSSGDCTYCSGVAEPIAAALALGQSLSEHGHDDLKLVSEHVGRIEHENAGRRQSEPGKRRADTEPYVEKFKTGPARHLGDEAIGGVFVLERVPDEKDAGRETRGGLADGGGKVCELGTILKWRIDQHDAAALLRRQQRFDGVPSVEIEHGRRLGAAKFAFQALEIFGVEFVGNQNIVGAHQLARDQGAARIISEFAGLFTARTASRYGATRSATGFGRSASKRRPMPSRHSPVLPGSSPKRS